MNFQIARIRLVSVGPEPARFDPLDLDLTRADGTGPADTVLFLPNTGGKTVLLRLIFSVLHPPVVAKIGSQEAGKQNRSLPDYVLADDIAHVMLEWRRTQDGRFRDDEVLITGLVAQWKGRATTDANGPDRLWYTIRGSTHTVGIDRLAVDTEVRDNGGSARRRLPLRVFREQLDEMGRRGRGAPVVTHTNKQTAWIDHLDQLGLDRVLLRYVGEMNRNEAGASSVARFNSDLDFIAFFLDVVMDPDEMKGLDQEIEGVADKVKRYPVYERRLRFEEAALVELDQLALGVAAVREAEGAARQARQAGTILLAQFTGGAAVAGERERAERGHWQQRDADAREQSANADRLRAESRDYRRMGATLWLTEVSQTYEAAKQRVARAALDVRAWAIAEDLVRLREAVAELVILDVEYSAEMARLRPLQEARDEAAYALARRLAGDAVLVLREEGIQKARALAARARAKERRTQTEQARIDAATCDAQREGCERRLVEIAEHRARLAAQGYLEAHERADDARDREGRRAREAQARIDAIDDEIAALEEERAQLDDLEQEAGPLRAETRANHKAMTETIARVQDARARLAAEPLVIELAETPAFDLELVGPAVAERLLGRAGEADAQRIELELRSVEDRRALRGLDESGFLPPPPDVEGALGRLRAAGITGAMPGTRYVADAVAAGRRHDVVARRADLVGGIVLIDPADLPRARSVLESASLSPSLIIAVGLGSALIEAESSAEAPTFVIPPTDALWDRVAAADERARRESRLAVLDDERTTIDERAKGARRLSEAIVRHVTQYPAGWLDARIAEQAGLARTLARLDAEHAQRDGRKREMASVLRTLRDEQGIRRKALLEAERRRVALDELATRETSTADLETRVTQLLGEANEWRTVAADYEAEAERADEEAGLAAQHAMDQRAAAERSRREQSEIVLATAVADPSPDEAERLILDSDLSELRARFDVLDERLKGEVSASDVAARRQSAIKVRVRLLDTIATHEPGERDRAEELIALPDAGTLPGRRAAAGRARAEASSAQEALTEAFATHKEAEKALADVEQEIKISKRTARASDLQRPADRHDAARLAAHARHQADVTQDRAGAAEREAAAARTAADAAKLLLDALAGLASQLRLTLGPGLDAAPPAMAPFDGDAEGARTTGSEMIERLSRATSTEDRAIKARAQRDLAVRQLLAREEFLDLAPIDTLYRRLQGSPLDVLSERVGELVVELRVAIAILRDELASLSQDLALATTSLAKSVNKAISYLRLAEARSKMPASLRDWAGLPFVTIRFNKPPAEELEARLTTFVADIVNRPSQRPAGTALLLQALERAVGQFTVQILKPNEAFAPTRVPVAELYSNKFSNGQRSTVATALMLMLSELRRQSRGAAHGASLGTILLDNPFGNANAGFLIEVQQTVAAAAGIQLVYTTGITDLSALRRFPNVIALSNDAARRSLRRWVRPNPALLALLVPSETRPGGRLSAARVVAYPNDDAGVRR